VDGSGKGPIGTVTAQELAGVQPGTDISQYEPGGDPAVNKVESMILAVKEFSLSSGSPLGPHVLIP